MGEQPWDASSFRMRLPCQPECSHIVDEPWRSKAPAITYGFEFYLGWASFRPSQSQGRVWRCGSTTLVFPFPPEHG